MINRAPRHRIIRQVRQWIEQGKVPAGEVLPSMQCIAGKLRTAPATVLAALQELEQEGLIQSLPNGRKKVVRFRRSHADSILSQTVVLLTDTDMGRLPTFRAPGATGWAMAVDHGVTSAIHSSGGMHLLVVRPSAMSPEHIEHLIEEPPYGLIVAPSGYDGAGSRDAAARFGTAGIPVVLPGVPPDIPAWADGVESDHEAGAYALTRWLIEQGRRRILRYWGMPANWDSRPGWLARRDAGYERACREAGLEPLPPVETRGVLRFPASADEFAHDANAVAGELWRHLRGPAPVDALMAITDGIATNLAAGCRVLELVPNRDVTIVGYDNYWENNPIRRWEPTPPAATMDKRNQLIGREMVEMLLARIDGRLPAAPQTRLVPPELIVNPAAPAAKPLADPALAL